MVEFVQLSSALAVLNVTVLTLTELQSTSKFTPRCRGTDRRECATTLETVKEGGGPDLWKAREEEIDHRSEKDRDAWDLYNRAYDTCWPDDDA